MLLYRGGNKTGLPELDKKSDAGIIEGRVKFVPVPMEAVFLERDKKCNAEDACGGKTETAREEIREPWSVCRNKHRHTG